MGPKKKRVSIADHPPVHQSNSMESRANYWNDRIFETSWLTYPPSASVRNVQENVTIDLFILSTRRKLTKRKKYTGECSHWFAYSVHLEKANRTKTTKKLNAPPPPSLFFRRLCALYSLRRREIKKAYYRLAVQHHPDKRPGDARSEVCTTAVRRYK